MARRRSDRPDQILSAARALLRAHGVSELTYEAIAGELGVTKQAVIYWFGTKEELLGELHLRILSDESEVLAQAVRDRSPAEAIRSMLQALLAHHAATDWQEFRLLYMTVQLVPDTRPMLTVQDRSTRVYPVTAGFYDAFEDALRPALGASARDAAVAIHLAAIGLATMSGLMDALDDTMRIGIPDLADVLADRLVAGLPTPD